MHITYRHWTAQDRKCFVAPDSPILSLFPAFFGAEKKAALNLCYLGGGEGGTHRLFVRGGSGRTLNPLPFQKTCIVSGLACSRLSVGGKKRQSEAGETGMEAPSFLPNPSRQFRPVHLSSWLIFFVPLLNLRAHDKLQVIQVLCYMVQLTNKMSPNVALDVARKNWTMPQWLYALCEVVYSDNFPGLYKVGKRTFGNKVTVASYPSPELQVNSSHGQE